MRIDKLKLTRYGHFTDFELNFEMPATTGSSDFHVLYGPNEAGKSTTLSAITDLLYGMERMSNWNFLHSSNLLLIEAELQQSDQHYSLQRFKNHIADETGERLAAFPLDLQGLSRDEYKRRFSFDEQTLRDGGEQILKSEGDIGQALFSASAGLSDLKAKIESAMSSANKFWMPNRIKNIRLKELKDELQANKKALAAANLDVSAWKARHKALAQSENLRLAAREEKNELVKSIKKLEIRITTQHSARNLVLLIKQRDILCELPIANTDACSRRGLNTAAQVRNEIESIRQLLDQKRQFDTRQQEQESRLATLSTELERLTIDRDSKAILDARVKIEILQAETSLCDEWRSRLSELESIMAQCDATLSTELQRLKMDPDTDIATLLPGENVIEGINSLVDEGKSLLSLVSHAQREAQNLASSKPDTPDTSKPVFDTSIASDIVKRLKEDALIQRLNSAVQSRLDTLTSVKTQAHELSMDHNTIDSLELPEESWLTLLLTRLSDARSDLNLLQSNITETEQQILDGLKHCEQMDQTGVVSDAHLVDSRNARNRAWQNHKNQLQTESSTMTLLQSAEEFEQHLTTHDEKEAAYRSGAENSARYSLLQLKIQQDRNTLQEYQHKTEQCREQIESLQMSIRSRVSSFYADAEIESESLRSKLAQVINLKATQSQWHKLNLTVEQLQTQCQEQCTLLLGVVKDYLSPELFNQLSLLELDYLLPQVEQIIQQEDARLQAYKEAMRLLQEHERATARRIREQQAAQDAQNAWKAKWTEATSATFLDGMSLAQAADAIQAFRKLDNTLTRKLEASGDYDALSGKIAARDADIEQLLTQLGHASLAELVESLSAVVKRSNEHERCTQQTGDAAAILEQTVISASHINSELDSLLALYGVSTSNDILPLLERTLELRGIEQRCDEERNQLQAITGETQPEEKLASLISDNDDEQLDALLLELQSRLVEAEALYDEYNQQWAIDNKALNAIGDDNEYARLKQKRANILLEIQEGAHATAQARCGQLVLQAAIARFRQEHQSTLLTNARQAFQTLTAGHYVNLIPHDDGKGNEQLMAVDEHQRSRAVNELSTGTRYQLYLALRAAAYADYARQRAPLPFVADDIMESFDDERSAAAFKVLGQMATHGQVLYMTHHQHLIGIAQEVLGKGCVKIHSYN